MTLVLVAAFCLLRGAYAHTWGVTYAHRPLARWAGSCVTIPCSFAYPAEWRVSAVIWMQDENQIVYHSDETRVHAAFKGRVRYLGDLQHNCSLRLAGLRPSDQGTYRFRFRTAAQSHPCQPSLGRRMEPGLSLTCSVGAACSHRPSWYDRDGAQRSAGQTPGGTGATELRISPSQLGTGVALRCQVDRYRNDCDSDQPLGSVTPRVEVSGPAGKAALREGDAFTLRCQAAALRPVAGYVWSRGDAWLAEAGQDLRVDRAAVSDAGSYACGVWVPGPGLGYLSLSARESVEVQHPPTGVRVTAAPGTSLQEGESVTLTCNYTSSLPAPNSYAWYRDDRQLEDLVGSQWEVVLKSITVEQPGEYHCQIGNGISRSQSPSINITVQAAPAVWSTTSIVASTVVLVLLLLAVLVGVIAWRKRWSKCQAVSNKLDQPGPGETPMSEHIYENTQHYGLGKPARQAPPGPPSAPTEVCPGSEDGTGESHIYSQPTNPGKVPQGDPDEVHYSAIQLHPPTRRAEPAADLACEYVAIKR